VVQADIIASNGLVHTMDAVLKSSFFYRSVIDLADTYTAFLSLIAMAGLEDTLRSDAWTFFAPTNDVINALPAETVTFLINTESASALVEVLTFHMITAVLTISDKLARLDSVVTIQGSEVTISLIGRVNVNGIPVVEPDILAVNGVTHGISGLLIPPLLVPVIPPFVDLAVATPAQSFLLTTVSAAGLVETLANPDASLTVFSPTNDAFAALPAALPAGILDALLTDTFSQHLSNVLLYHVLGAVVLAGDLSDGQVATALNGEDLTIGIDGDGAVTLVNGAGTATPIIDTDILASNGVAHVIGGVLLLSFFVYRTVVDLSTDYSTVVSLIAMADLEDTLRSDAWTFFAPSNEAIAALPVDTVAFLTSAEGMLTLVDILKYHLTTAVLTSDKLSNGATAVTIQGGAITVGNTGIAVTVNNIPVIEVNILAVTGVTHGISRVLLPNVDVTVAPTDAPATKDPTAAPADSAPSAFGKFVVGLLVMVWALAF
jgi:transforming growth factor-beta-induced protein